MASAGSISKRQAGLYGLGGVYLQETGGSMWPRRGLSPRGRRVYMASAGSISKRQAGLSGFLLVLHEFYLLDKIRAKQPGRGVLLRGAICTSTCF